MSVVGKRGTQTAGGINPRRKSSTGREHRGRCAASKFHGSRRKAALHPQRIASQLFGKLIATILYTRVACFPLVQNRAKACLIVPDRHRYEQIWANMFRMHVPNHHATYLRSNAYENATISFCKSLTDSYNIKFPPASCIDQALYSTTASSLVLWAEVHVLRCLGRW